MFRISQTPTNSNLFLYPSDDTAQCTHLLPYPVGGKNYVRVDEPRGSPQDDGDYVYLSNAASTTTDLYAFQDSPGYLNSSSINYVEAYVRCRVTTVGSGPTVRIAARMLGDSWSRVTDYDSNLVVTDVYQNFSKKWVSTPSLGSWTWKNIDYLKLGLNCNSPSIYLGLDFISRPMSTVSMGSGFVCIPGGQLWSVTDDVIPNDDEEYVTHYGAISSWLWNLCNMNDHSSETGAIDNVTVFFRVRKTDDYGHIRVRPMLSLDGTTFSFGSTKECNIFWETFSETFTLDPTGGAWSWTDIDNLIYGFGEWSDTEDSAFRCTQLYVVVNYHQLTYPDVRMTQCYMKVNYTPSPTVVYLNMPEEYNYGHGRELGHANFPDNTRQVFDIKMREKTLSMMGVDSSIVSSSVTARLSAIKGFQDAKTKVTFSDFIDNTLNRDWFIKDFQYRQDKENSNLWLWSLEAVKA